MASAAEVAEMDNAVREVRKNYEPARASAARARLFGGVLATSQQLAAAKAIEDLGAIIERWASTMYQNALRGKNSEQRDYTPAQFLDFARKDIASAIRTYRDGIWEGSLFSVVVNTATQTVKDTAKVVSPFAWPVHVKVLAGVAAGVAVLVLLSPYARLAQKVVR
jgi:hypothetical protein